MFYVSVTVTINQNPTLYSGKGKTLSMPGKNVIESRRERERKDNKNTQKTTDGTSTVNLHLPINVNMLVLPAKDAE